MDAEKKQFGREKATDVDNLITHLHLERIEREFLNPSMTPLEEYSRITFEEFKEAMGYLLQYDVSEKKLRVTFNKVDVCGDGTITWQEFLHYMKVALKWEDEASSFSLYKPFASEPKTVKKDLKKYPDKDRYIKLPKGDFLISIIFYETRATKYIPSVSKEGQNFTVLERKVLAVSERGILDFWTSDFRKCSDVKTTHCSGDNVRITSAVVMENVNLVALASTNRDIVFYSCQSLWCSLKYQIQEFDHCVLCMDYHIDPNKPMQSLLIVGYDNGEVGYFDFEDIEVTFPFGLWGSDSMRTVMKFRDIARSKKGIIIYKSFPIRHDDWVRQVKYVHSLESIFSCANCYRMALCVRNMASAQTQEFKVNKGLLCFDYCPTQHVIVTGGMDYNVRIWNPQITEKPNATLMGHSAPIFRVMIDSRRHLLISVSRNKQVYIWDMDRKEPVQRLEANVIATGWKRITAAAFDKTSETIVIGSRRLDIFERTRTEVFAKTHGHPITGVLYGKAFDLVIIGCQGSLLSVWDLNTGANVHEFSSVHTKTVRKVVVPLPITAMTLDKKHKRLATGSENGIIKMWNYTNGDCILQLSIQNKKTIRQISLSAGKILAIGEFNRVAWFLDDPAEKTIKYWRAMHEDEITGMDCYEERLLTTVSYDGVIVVWEVKKGFPKYILFDQKKMEPIKRATLAELRSSRRQKSSVGFRTSLPETQVWRYANADSVVFLQTRPQAEDSLTFLTTSKDGYIRGWAISANSVPLCRFFAPSRKSDAVTCIKVNVTNMYLITGDTSGYIRVWYLLDFQNDAIQPSDEVIKEQQRRFVYMRLAARVEEMKRRVVGEEQDDDYVLGKPPRLLNSFRGHMYSVTSVEFVEVRELLLSSSTDKTVRLWTIEGRYIGTFGQKECWSINPEIYLDQTPVIPADIATNASAMTLKVLNGGHSRRWGKALSAVLFSVRLIITVLTAERLGANQAQKGVLLEEEESLNLDMMEDTLGKLYVGTQFQFTLPVIAPIPFCGSLVCPFTCLPIVEVDPVPKYVAKGTVTTLNEKALKTDRNKIKNGRFAFNNEKVSLPALVLPELNK